MNTVEALRPFRRLLPAGATLLIALSAPATSRAAIIADFTGGNGTESPDQWTGTAGAGWATPWASSGSTTGTGVTNTSPLHGGGDYLQFVDTAASGAAYIRRQMDGSSGVNLMEPYTLTLSFRYDAPSLSGFDSFDDRIAIFANPTAAAGTGATNTWIIGVSGSIHSGNWYFFDRGSSDAFTAANMHDTGLALVVGRVYAITVEVDPLAGTYSAAIDDGINPIVSATDLNFRRGATGDAANWVSVNINNSTTTDSGSFSVDNIRVVHEPSAAVGLLIGAGMMAMRRRRAK